MDAQGGPPWRQFKRMLGLFLFWLSWLLWALVLVAPFVMDVDVEAMAMFATAMLVVAEISFIVSLLLLGRDFYQAIKQRLRYICLTVIGKKPAD